MSVIGNCPKCGHVFQRPDGLAGKLEKCPKCRYVFRLPVAVVKQESDLSKAGPSRIDRAPGAASQLSSARRDVIQQSSSISQSPPPAESAAGSPSMREGVLDGGSVQGHVAGAKPELVDSKAAISGDENPEEKIAVAAVVKEKPEHEIEETADKKVQNSASNSPNSVCRPELEPGLSTPRLSRTDGEQDAAPQLLSARQDVIQQLSASSQSPRVAEEAAGSHGAQQGVGDGSVAGSTVVSNPEAHASRSQTTSIGPLCKRPRHNWLVGWKVLLGVSLGGLAAILGVTAVVWIMSTRLGPNPEEANATNKTAAPPKQSSSADALSKQLPSVDAPDEMFARRWMLLAAASQSDVGTVNVEWTRDALLSCQQGSPAWLLACCIAKYTTTASGGRKAAVDADLRIAQEELKFAKLNLPGVGNRNPLSDDMKRLTFDLKTDLMNIHASAMGQLAQRDLALSKRYVNADYDSPETWDEIVNAFLRTEQTLNDSLTPEVAKRIVQVVATSFKNLSADQANVIHSGEMLLHEQLDDDRLKTAHRFSTSIEKATTKDLLDSREKVRAMFRKVLDENPEFRESLRHGAKVLCDTETCDLRDARKQTQSRVMEASKYQDRGLAYSKTGELGKANADYNEATRLNVPMAKSATGGKNAGQK